MAHYQYDESGLLASYFILTFLSLALIPLTLSFLPSTARTPQIDDCDCKSCQDKRVRLKQLNKSSLRPQLGAKILCTAAGWLLFGFLAYKVSTTKSDTTIYDPFNILGISSSATEKEVKRHYKKLSLKFHPDKVQLAINQTMAQAESHFVDLTKAYKSLTDEVTRENLQKYGHPDGKQDFSMGLALPKWVVESKNNIWILGLYGLLFGGALPMLVGNWWFASRKHTKDGVLAATAQTLFKSVREETPIETLIATISKVWELEGGKGRAPSSDDKDALNMVENQIRKAFGSENWTTVRKAASTVTSSSPTSALSPCARRALILLYAHLLRIPIPASLQAEQNALLLSTPAVLTSMLSMTLAHSWLSSSLNVMHLHAHLAQALAPGKSPLLQFPSIEEEDTKPAAGTITEVGVVNLIKNLETKNDPRAESVKQVADRWGRLDVVDAQFKVIGERIVNPGAIVQLVFKARIVPPTSATSSTNGLSANGNTSDGNQSDITLAENGVEILGDKKHDTAKDERELEFLTGKKDAEDLDPIDAANATGYAHAPHWPSNRKPQWWVLIGDQKLNRVIVPPMKFSEVPFARQNKSHGEKGVIGKNYRTYKLQFQAPPQEGVYTFQLHFVSDTFVGEDVRRHVVLKVEETSVEAGAGDEDDISDPEEDSLAGQMAAMRGGKVKRSPYHGDDGSEEEEEDDDSSTDDDDEDDSDSSSDSD